MKRQTGRGGVELSCRISGGLWFEYRSGKRNLFVYILFCKSAASLRTFKGLRSFSSQFCFASTTCQRFRFRTSPNLMFLRYDPCRVVRGTLHHSLVCLPTQFRISTHRKLYTATTSIEFLLQFHQKCDDLLLAGKSAMLLSRLTTLQAYFKFLYCYLMVYPLSTRCQQMLQPHARFFRQNRINRSVYQN